MTRKIESGVVYTATRDWYQIVDRSGELVLGEPWEGEWERAAEIAEIDVDDGESWVCRVEEIADRHSAIHVGDYCCCQGIGADMVFVRLSD